MRKVRSVIAALLVAVFVLGALNVSVAGQRDRLRQKVQRQGEAIKGLRTEVELLKTDPANVQLLKERIDFIAETHRNHIDYLIWSNIQRMNEIASLETRLDDHEARIAALETP